jgi:hypothetical protein
MTWLSVMLGHVVMVGRVHADGGGRLVGGLGQGPEDKLTRSICLHGGLDRFKTKCLTKSWIG